MTDQTGREILLSTGEYLVPGQRRGGELTGLGVYRASIGGGQVAAPTRLGLDVAGGVPCAVLRDPERPGRLYAASEWQGVWRSDDDGATWAHKSEGMANLQVWHLNQHPLSGDLYAGTEPAALYRSTDGAESWEELRSMRLGATARRWSFPAPPFIAHVKTICLDPTDPDRIFVAVEEGWIVRSDDRGKSWENILTGTEFDAHTADWMPDDPSIVVHTSGQGVYRSTDGGLSFTEASDGLADRTYMRGFAVDPRRPKRLFTTGAQVPPPFWDRRPEGASAAFFVSHDQGAHWEQVTNGVPEWFRAAPLSVTIDPSDPDTSLVGMSDGTLWLSHDGAGSFRQVLDGLPPITGITFPPAGAAAQ